MAAKLNLQSGNEIRRSHVVMSVDGDGDDDGDGGWRRWREEEILEAKEKMGGERK